MDVRDLCRVREAEDVGEVLEVFVMAGEPLAADAALVEPEGLNLRAHRAIEHQDPLREQRIEQVGFVDDGLRAHGICRRKSPGSRRKPWRMPCDEGKQGFHGASERHPLRLQVQRS